MKALEFAAIRQTKECLEDGSQKSLQKADSIYDFASRCCSKECFTEIKNLWSTIHK